jgi:crotonobetainyl-CoA:carnitine CoA-transferase CaiB-like acyl-CoA transferase
LLPGPFATQLLADMRADVISVEPPGGDAIRERNPGVVYCSLTGPNSDRPAHGLNVSGMAGFLHENRPAADAPPTLPSFSVADQSLGLVAAVCLLGGLLGRERTGGTQTDSERTGANHSGRRGTYIAVLNGRGKQY